MDCRRHQGRQDQAGQREELDAAGAHLAQHVGVGTELAVREHLHVETAVGLGLDRGGHLAGARHERMRLRQVVGELVGELGRLRARHMGRGNAAEHDGGGGSLEQAAA